MSSLTARAMKPGSTATCVVSASRDFGVLEQDVLIEPFIELCRAAGFRHAAVCPIAYVIPEFELSLEEWRSWTRLPRTKRPYRALDKMMRAALELVGAGKESVLFEEAYAMRLVRLLQVPVEEHPFFIAAKSDKRRTYPATYRATIAVESLPDAVPPGQRAQIAATLTNVGTAPWRAQPDAATGTGHVRLGLQLLDASSRVIDNIFPLLVPPATSLPASRVVKCPAWAEVPAAAGEHGLKIDLVAEGVTWFEPAGTIAAIRPLTVNRGPVKP